MESFEEDGYWWQPENPDNKIAGRLSFNPDTGGQLSLLGDLDGIERLGKMGDQITIHGISESGKQYSLFECLKNSSSLVSSGFLSSGYLVTTIIKGHFFANLDDIRFDSFRVYFKHLDDWLGQVILFITFPKGIETSSNRYSLEYNPESLPENIIPNFGKIEFLYSHNIHSEPLPVIHNFTAKTEFYVKFTPELPASYDDVLNRYSSDFCNFLTLAIQNPSYPYKITGFINSINMELGGISHPTPIEVYQDLNYLKPKEKRIPPHEMLFSYRTIQTGFSEYYQNWIGLSRSIKPCIDLYFSTQYRKSLYLEDSFQKVIQAIEVYHRRSEKYGGEFCMKEEYEPLLQSFLDQIPVNIDGDFRNSLKNKLSYNYQYSLRKRIQDLLVSCVDEYGSTFSDLYEKPSDWAKKVADRRNFLTHRENDQEIDHHELYLWMLQGSLLLQILFSREIGFDKESIIERIEKNNLLEQIRLNRLH